MGYIRLKGHDIYHTKIDMENIRLKGHAYTTLKGIWICQTKKGMEYIMIKTDMEYIRLKGYRIY